MNKSVVDTKQPQGNYMAKNNAADATLRKNSLPKAEKAQNAKPVKAGREQARKQALNDGGPYVSVLPNTKAVNAPPRTSGSK
jgi:hypothetical protein